MKKKLLLFAVFAALISSNILAQEKVVRGGRRWASKEDREKIEAMINWKLVEYLEINESASEKLFPLMKQYNEERHRLFVERRKVVDKLFDLSENKNITKEDVKSELRDLEKFHELMNKNRTNFYEKAETFLNDRQYIRLLIFEEKLKDDVMRQFRERHDLRGRDEQNKPENK